MKYLVDTHIFLWWLQENNRLKFQIKEILSQPDNIIYVSVISGWELSIKSRTKSKLKLKTTIEDCYKKAGLEILDIKLPHVLQLTKLSILHKDPFDRMLIAQAQVEDATIITTDEKIWQYKVALVKA